MLPDPLLLGFVLKRPWVPAGDWFRPGFNRVVERVCSVSSCLAERPPDDWGRLNGAYLYDTKADAQARLPTGDTEGWLLFAYRLLPVRLLEDGSLQAVALADFLYPDATAPRPDPDLSGFTSLGWDAISSTVTPMECSPLSCNNLASEVPVNRHCLLDDPQVALDFARRCDREQPEPGTYHVIEVLAAD
jgi:hypothetical protein